MVEEDPTLRDSPSALQVLMMGHQTKQQRQSVREKRIFLWIISALGTIQLPSFRSSLMGNLE
jgi:hypothetical protein